jgi:lipoprotein-anchoring transpeptidase ErfK/SrfK
MAMQFSSLSLKLPSIPDRAAGMVRAALVALMGSVLCQCSSSRGPADVVVSVKDQKLGFYQDGKLTKEFKVSTSKFGLGDKPGSCCTPLGKAEVIAKIGNGLPPGAVLKSRSWNGEVLQPNAPGRDPIVSRILWLRGLEKTNRNAFNRYIYIHGTTEEDRLGSPASYGCIRMGARDVVDLFNATDVGAKVVITKSHLPGA